MSSDKFLNIADFEAKAHSVLPKNARDYYNSGACDEISLRDSRAAYARFQLLPNVLVDVSKIDTSIELFGARIRTPICVAPAAMQCMAHPDGEAATARACARFGTVMGLSSLSTTSLEDVASAAPDGLRWFQLYVYKDRAVAIDLVRRAEAAGYTALAVTVDAPILGRREADARNRFQLPAHLKLGNFTDKSKSTTVSADGSGVASYFSLLIDDAVTWKDLVWLKQQTRLPVIVKGVLTPAAVKQAVAHGMDAVWVSNHGARQLDTVPSTIEALHDIHCALGRLPIPLLLDGGIMRGTDIIKALALGAQAVFIGRPMLWGLACGGEQGVHRVLQILQEELEQSMKLCGVACIEDITPALVRRADRSML